MQPDIEVACTFALNETGNTYIAQDPYRWWAGNDDCSSLVIKSLRAAGIIVPESVRNTVGLYTWGRDIGGLRSVQEGYETRGYVMIKGRTWGFGSKGHASISLGGGLEMAAHGVRSGVHSNYMNASMYNDSLRIPMVNYHDVPEIDWNKIVQLEVWRQQVTVTPLKFGDRSENVRTLNALLVKRGLVVRDTKTGYGTVTRDGVHHLKRVKPMPDGNVNGMSFGGPAADALLGIA